MGNIKHASSLDLSNKGLTEIPSFVFGCRNLKSLKLSGNQIEKIPIELSRLKYLKKLDLSNNNIKQILSKTFELVNLEVLNLNNNKIKSLPKHIGSLLKLKKLLLAGNSLVEIPIEIGKLIELRELNLSQNKIERFPTQLFQLSHLKRLWLNKNNFKYLPTMEMIKGLPELKSLYTFNPVSDILGIDSNTALLSKKRGNALSDLKLMTYNDDEKVLDGQIVRKTKKPTKKIFVSYSHNDKDYKDEVIKTLKGLKNVFPDLNFYVWSDECIRTGTDWLKEIETALDEAAVAVMIVSRDFISSEFIMQKEVPALLQNAELKGTIIVNLIAGKSLFKHMILSKFQSVNNPEEPLKGLTAHEQDVVYNKLAEDIKSYLSE